MSIERNQILSVNNPKKYWLEISKRKDWRDFILPRKTDKEFEEEGFIESQRLYYFCDNTDVVIDFGCGIGRVSKYVAPRVKKLIGLDISKDFVKKARRNVKFNNVNFYQSDKYKKKEDADFLYCLMVMQHNDDINREKIINQIRDLLKKGGKCLIQFPKKESNYYEESDFVHKFAKVEVSKYGKIFKSFNIIEGNLPNYASEIDYSKTHEYFLIAEK